MRTQTHTHTHTLVYCVTHTHTQWLKYKPDSGGRATQERVFHNSRVVPRHPHHLYPVSDTEDLLKWICCYNVTYYIMPGLAAGYSLKDFCHLAIAVTH